MIPGAILLCGGMSRRMGRSKASLPFGGESMLERVARLVSTEARPLVIVAAEGQILPALTGDVIKTYDIVTGKGPLQGLSSGFASLPESVELVYAAATDVPLLKPLWIRRLVELIGDDDLAIPFVGGHYHPLAALYRRSTVAPTIDRLLAEDRLRPVFLMESCRTRIVTEAELILIDPALDTLRNLNTPDEYRLARKDAGIDVAEVTIELHGVPRLKAGFARFPCRADTVGQALDALGEASEPIKTTVLVDGFVHPAYKLNINGDRFVEGRDEMLVEGDELLLLAADVGG